MTEVRTSYPAKFYLTAYFNHSSILYHYTNHYSLFFSFVNKSRSTFMSQQLIQSTEKGNIQEEKKKATNIYTSRSIESFPFTNALSELPTSERCEKIHLTSSCMVCRAISCNNSPFDPA